MSHVLGSHISSLQVKLLFLLRHYEILLLLIIVLDFVLVFSSPRRSLTVIAMIIVTDIMHLNISFLIIVLGLLILLLLDARSVSWRLALVETSSSTITRLNFLNSKGCKQCKKFLPKVS